MTGIGPTWTAVNGPQPSQVPLKDKCPKAEIFDGDDLGLDDFLAADQHRENAKGGQPKRAYSYEDDWISIGNTPSPPPPEKPRKAQSDLWEIETDSQGESKEEPVRLANGNWACNHKCKDKKGYANSKKRKIIGAPLTLLCSCKHLCCKIGLEKRPKPAKKKVSTSQKPSGLNQLTLSATITKADSAKKSQKPQAKAGTKPKLDEQSRSTLPVRQTETTKSKQKTDETQNEPNFPSKSKRPGKASQVVAKKYLDDDLTDFLSSWDPSEETWSDFPQLPSIQTPKVDESAMICIDLTSEKSPYGSPSKTLNPPTTEPARSVGALGGEAQSSLTTPINTRTTDHWFDNTLPPGDEVFTSPLNTNSTPLTMPFTMRSGNIPSLKRKARTPEEQLQEPPQKKVEEYSSQEIISAFTTLNEPDEEYPSTESSDSGWDDVDRLLLEELKNIANFH